MEGKTKKQGGMLTLTRKVGESIRIGDDIELVVKEIRKNQVRLGVRAPREVEIHRGEVALRVDAERAAADVAPPLATGEDTHIALVVAVRSALMNGGWWSLEGLTAATQRPAADVRAALRWLVADDQVEHRGDHQFRIALAGTVAGSDRKSTSARNT